jgi:hypothetical protein
MWFLFYKGTGIHIPIASERQDTAIKAAEDSITTGLRLCVSLDTIKSNIIEDLNEMESWMNTTFPNGYTDDDLINNMGNEKYKKFTTKWTLNVICALKLKLIKNDDKNGHFYF